MLRSLVNCVVVYDRKRVLARERPSRAGPGAPLLKSFLRRRHDFSPVAPIFLDLELIEGEPDELFERYATGREMRLHQLITANPCAVAQV